MADNGRHTTAAVYLLVRYPPVHSDQDTVGGWELEAWHGGDRSWAISLTDFGAHHGVDQDLAQEVADRTLRTRLVEVDSWLPCGSGHAPMFLARLTAGTPETRGPVITTVE